MADERGTDGGPTVLVVAEDPAVADRYGRWLAGRYDVRAVEGDEDAVDLLREAPDAIDAVLLNRRTSEVADDPVLVSIRDAGFDCPLALVTDRRPDSDVVTGGLDDHLTEPVTEEALLRTVGSLLAVEGREALRRELPAKRVRRNVLRLEHPPEELEANEPFARLEREIEQLERRLSLHREWPESRKQGEPAMGT